METSIYKRIVRLELAIADIVDYLDHPGQPIGPEALVEKYEALRERLEPLLRDVERIG